ncbi:hypothetical protein [Candidatus Sororendozoicomonas aggregata]|uniref:hypothetical protein n=1 Tax=Candidatus Sororendozoicomonas aggregata TaxID=3073239 RepID=UPI002ED1C5BA
MNSLQSQVIPQTPPPSYEEAVQKTRKTMAPFKQKLLSEISGNPKLMALTRNSQDVVLSIKNRAISLLDYPVKFSHSAGNACLKALCKMGIATESYLKITQQKMEAAKKHYEANLQTIEDLNKALKELQEEKQNAQDDIKDSAQSLANAIKKLTDAERLKPHGATRKQKEKSKEKIKNTVLEARKELNELQIVHELNHSQLAGIQEKLVKTKKALQISSTEKAKTKLAFEKASVDYQGVYKKRNKAHIGDTAHKQPEVRTETNLFGLEVRKKELEQAILAAKAKKLWFATKAMTANSGKALLKASESDTYLGNLKAELDDISRKIEKARTTRPSQRLS